MSDTETEVFFYLDELYEKKKLDLGQAPRDIRIFFHLPPARSAEIVSKWAKAFTKRQRKEANS